MSSRVHCNVFQVYETQLFIIDTQTFNIYVINNFTPRNEINQWNTVHVIACVTSRKTNYVKASTLQTELHICTSLWTLRGTQTREFMKRTGSFLTSSMYWACDLLIMISHCNIGLSTDNKDYILLGVSLTDCIYALSIFIHEYLNDSHNLIYGLATWLKFLIIIYKCKTVLHACAEIATINYSLHMR